MNRLYLGDALDFWKGALISHLIENGALKNLMVDPMITDHASWDQSSLNSYRRLLKLEKAQTPFISMTISDRDRHFKQLDAHEGDLFLDPDTGIQTSRPAKEAVGQYVKPDELYSLLMRHPGRVIAVYQHIRAQKTRERVETCIKAVGQACAGLHWCSYESATVAMLFLSFHENRLEPVEKSLMEMLSVEQPRRVYRG